MGEKGTDYQKGDFSKLSAKLAARKGTKGDPDALAAYIMRRKYGAKKWKQIQAEGRKD